jgi:hypothetical protein
MRAAALVLCPLFFLCVFPGVELYLDSAQKNPRCPKKMSSELHPTYVEFLSGITIQVRATASADTLTFSGDGADVELKGVADPTVAQAAATKAYVDANGGSGLWQPSPRVATTVAGTLATSFASGQSVDGVTLITGDRILIKNQVSGVENGVYDVQVGAPTRASDFAAALAVSSYAMYVIEGSANAGSAWSCTNAAGSDVVGTDALVFAAFAGAIGTNLAVASITATTLDVTSSTGTDATLPQATGALAGLMSAADKTALDAATTTAYGTSGFTGNLTITPIALVSTFYPLFDAYVNGPLQDFTCVSGLFTYTGTETKWFSVNANWSWEASGAGQDVHMRIQKNAVLVPNAVIRGRVDDLGSVYPANGGTNAAVQLATNDTLEIRISSNSTAGVFVHDINVSITQAGASDDSKDPEIRKQEPTGVISGGLLTVNADDTKYDISDGTGIIVNPVTGVVDSVAWTGKTALSTAYAGNITYVSLDASATPVYRTVRPTNTQMRDEIFLGVLVHTNGTNLNATNDEQSVSLNVGNQLQDLARAIGFINVSGNAPGPSLLLKIAKTLGFMYGNGINYKNALRDPNLLSLPAIDTNAGGQFQYRYQNGSSSALTLTDLLPAQYDDGNGVGAPGVVGATEWQVQRWYSFTSNALKIQPGQAVYPNKEDAVMAIVDEAFVTEPSIAGNGMLIGYCVLRGGATDVNLGSDAEFRQASKFASGSGGGAPNVFVSENYGEMSVQAIGAAFSSNDSAWNELVSPEAVWSIGENNNFTLTNGNRLRYDGLDTLVFRCTGELSMEGDDFDGLPIDLGIFKNEALERFMAFTAYDDLDPDNCSVTKLLSLATNDRVEIRWRRRAGAPPAHDFTVYSASVVITRA